MAALDLYPGVRNVVVAAAYAEYERVVRRRANSDGLDLQLSQWGKEAANLRKAIRLGGHLESLVADLVATERTIAEGTQEKEISATLAYGNADLESRESISDRLGQIVIDAANSSFPFAALLRRAIPVFQVQPVQALDCGQVRPRVRLTLRFASWAAANTAPLESSTVIDAFEYPEHVKHRPAIVAARSGNGSITLRALAAQLDVNYMTVKRALSYDLRMRECGLEDPYRELLSLPEQASRWRN